MTVADVHADGLSDVVITAPAVLRTFICLGRGDGTFAAPRHLPDSPELCGKGCHCASKAARGEDLQVPGRAAGYPNGSPADPDECD